MTKSYDIANIELVFQNTDDFKFHRTKLISLLLEDLQTDIVSGESGKSLTIFTTARKAEIQFDATLLKEKTRFNDRNTLGDNLKFKHISSIYIETNNNIIRGYGVPWKDGQGDYGNLLEQYYVRDNIITITWEHLSD